MIKLDKTPVDALRGNYVAVKLTEPTSDGDTYTTLVHNGVEWLVHSFHPDRTDAYGYIADLFTQVVAERRSHGKGM